MALGACALALATLAAAPAAAQDEGGLAGEAEALPRRGAKFATQKGWVVLDAAWRDAVSAAIEKKLWSGLPTVIAARIYLFPEGGDEPLSLAVKTCRIVYDLWDEVFRIELRQGGTVRNTVAVNLEGVQRRCGQARLLPVADTVVLAAGQRYFAGLLVEVNPVGKQILERIRRWVTLPSGAGTITAGDSLFGSFVGLFVTHVPAADRTVAFRTQFFTPAELEVVPAPP
ncbi:MAG: hypothetical protein IT373_35160 [Polyangiaceae bacterium]|nr:hypothetical protein [Polyangiaceae bacterium]